MSDKLTTQQYTCATIFVDQYSGFSYTWIQRSTSVENTLQGKHAFKRLAGHHGVKIQHYHADNGVFRAREWVADCYKHQQSMSSSRSIKYFTTNQGIDIEQIWNETSKCSPFSH